MLRFSTTPVSCSIRSASVDLPWSMCAMMQKLRITDWSVRPGSMRSAEAGPVPGDVIGDTGIRLGESTYYQSGLSHSLGAAVPGCRGRQAPRPAGASCHDHPPLHYGSP